MSAAGIVVVVLIGIAAWVGAEYKKWLKYKEDLERFETHHPGGRVSEVASSAPSMGEDLVAEGKKLEAEAEEKARSESSTTPKAAGETKVARASVVTAACPRCQAQVERPGAAVTWQCKSCGVHLSMAPSGTEFILTEARINRDSRSEAS